MLFEHSDPEHERFLRAGYARIVLTVRPGFEEDFTNLMENRLARTGFHAPLPDRRRRYRELCPNELLGYPARQSRTAGETVTLSGAAGHVGHDAGGHATGRCVQGGERPLSRQAGHSSGHRAAASGDSPKRPWFSSRFLGQPIRISYAGTRSGLRPDITWRRWRGGWR